MSLQKRGVWGAAPARGVGGGGAPPSQKNYNCFHLKKNTYQINSGHILNALGILLYVSLFGLHVAHALICFAFLFFLCPFYMSGATEDILCRSESCVHFLWTNLNNVLHKFWRFGTSLLTVTLCRIGYFYKSEGQYYVIRTICYFANLAETFFQGFSDLPNNEMTNNLYFCDSVILSLFYSFNCVIISISKYLLICTQLGTYIPQCNTSGCFFSSIFTVFIDFFIFFETANF